MPKILVADDEPNIRMVLKLALSSADYEVIAVEDGLAGIKTLTEGFQPDLILVDLNMPRLSGKEFISEVRSIDSYEDIPILILSGSIPGLGDFPPQGTYQGVITKPFDLEQLLNEVNYYCGQRQLSIVAK